MKYFIPGNRGTEKLAQNVTIDFNDFEKINFFIR